MYFICFLYFNTLFK